jgi:hypothetical protein
MKAESSASDQHPRAKPHRPPKDRGNDTHMNRHAPVGQEDAGHDRTEVIRVPTEIDSSGDDDERAGDKQVRRSPQIDCRMLTILSAAIVRRYAEEQHPARAILANASGF